MKLFDRWMMSTAIMRAPEGETGAAAPIAAAAGEGASAAAAPAAEAAPATAAPAVDTSAAPAASTEAPAAQESASSLLGSAEAKLPGDDAAAASPDQGSAPPAKEGETAKPATDETAKPDAAKDGKDGKADAPAPADEALAQKPQAPTYDAFKTPDGVKFDDAQVKSFTDLLDNAELSHQDRAQKLIDMHVGEINRVIQEQRDHQLKSWSDFTDSLKSDFKKDPELGGNRQETSLGIAKYVLEQMGGNADQQKDLIRMMNHTGMGNHLGLIRLLNNVYERFLDTPSPVPGQAPNQATRGNFQDVMYGPGPNGRG